MKRLTVLLLGIVLVVVMAGMASAASSDSITLKVACVVGLSVAIDKDEYNFGDVAAQIPTISTEAIVVSNDSGGRTEDYQINSATCTAAWNLITSDPSGPSDENKFSLKAMFKTTQPSGTDFPAGSYLNTDAGDQQNMDINFGTTGYSGDNVGDGVDRNLWFRLHTPWSTTTENQQQFSVTITAVDAGTFSE